MSDLANLFDESVNPRDHQQPYVIEKWAAQEIERLRSEITAAKAENEALRGQLEQAGAREQKLSKFIVMNSDRLFHGDHACAQCHPHSDILVDGFECGFHLAQRLRQQAEAAEKGADDDSRKV